MGFENNGMDKDGKDKDEKEGRMGITLKKMGIRFGGKHGVGIP